ncbi:MAG: DMT family transporter [Candidatus Thorarchaeota archaeon]|nr:DMT family transporter [Candidatus Thorarchaeota archaeon]
MSSGGGLGSHKRIRIGLLLLLSISMVSSASVLIKMSSSHPLVIVFWRTLLGGILMALAALPHRGYQSIASDGFRECWKWLLLIGMVLSLHFYTWFTSLTLTTIPASVALVNISPIFTAAFSTFVLREPLGRVSWSGVLVAVTGVFVVAWNDLTVSGLGAVTGDLLSIISGFLLAVYFIGGRRYAKGLPIAVYTMIVYLSAAGATLLLCFAMSIDVVVLDAAELTIFLALALFPTALGHSVNNYLLTLVPAYVVSSAVLGEPIGATILGILVFGESQIPTPLGLVGFVVVLSGIGLVLAGVGRGSSQSDHGT